MIQLYEVIEKAEAKEERFEIERGRQKGSLGLQRQSSCTKYLFFKN